MLVVTVEVWPGGKKLRKKVLARGVIANDRTGTTDSGNYTVELRGPGAKPLRGKVYRWHRLEQNVWLLIAEAIRDATGYVDFPAAPIPEAVTTADPPTCCRAGGA